MLGCEGEGAAAAPAGLASSDRSLTSGGRPFIPKLFKCKETSPATSSRASATTAASSLSGTPCSSRSAFSSEAAQDLLGEREQWKAPPLPGPLPAQRLASARGPVSARGRGLLQRARIARHLSEALEEGASKAVLQHALTTAKEHRCSGDLVAHAFARLQGSESAAEGASSHERITVQVNVRLPVARARGSWARPDVEDTGMPVGTLDMQFAKLGLEAQSPEPSPRSSALAALLQEVWQDVAVSDTLTFFMGAVSVGQFRCVSRAGRECMRMRSVSQADRAAALCALEAAEGFDALQQAIQAARAKGLAEAEAELRPFQEKLAAAALHDLEVREGLDAEACERRSQVARKVGASGDILRGVVQRLDAATSFEKLRAGVRMAQALGASRQVMQPFVERLATAMGVQETLAWGISNLDIAAIREAVQKSAAGMLSTVQVAHAKSVLEAEEAKMNERRAAARHEICTTAMEVQKLDTQHASLDGLLSVKQRLEAVLAQAAAAGLSELEVAALDRHRRKVHNAIEDRRGAVRVHCRVRPLTAREIGMGECEAVRCRGSFAVEVRQGRERSFSEREPCERDEAPRRCNSFAAIAERCGTFAFESEGSEEDGAAQSQESPQSRPTSMHQPSPCKAPGPATNFSFDACWAGGAQADVFEGIRDLVQSAVDGYNVTVLAYGQTGAGKTHTMYGPREASRTQRLSKAGLTRSCRSEPNLPEPDEMRGICPRTTAEIFRIATRDSARFQFTVTLSMVELYCQRFIDLLGRCEERPLKIRTLPSGEVYLENLQEKVVDSPSDVEEFMSAGLRERHIRSTSLNSCSSRSHVLFCLKIASVNRETGDTAQGKIVLIDLAGSERVKKSEVQGEGLREAIEVNRSLSALSDVVAAVARGERHVPYRNHELTQVMQGCLGGNAKTLMLLNLSPLACHGEETMMSIKFAQRIKGATGVVLKARPTPTPSPVLKARLTPTPSPVLKARPTLTSNSAMARNGSKEFLSSAPPACDAAKDSEGA